MFYSVSMELNSLQINVEEVKFSELKYLWPDVAACKPLSLLSVWPAFQLVLPINVSQVNLIWMIIWVLKNSMLPQTPVSYTAVCSRRYLHHRVALYSHCALIQVSRIGD